MENDGADKDREVQMVMIKLKEILVGKPFSIMQPNGSIPWDAIASHEKQARMNHGGQSLETLARRGGLSPSEAVAVLEDRPWRSMDTNDALTQLQILVKPWSEKV